MGVAMYCVLLLLTELERNEQLDKTFKKLNLELKFVGIKLFVFLPILQKMIVEKLFPFFDVLKSYEDEPVWTEEYLSIAVQNFLVCVETAVFSLFSFAAFRLSDFSETSNDQGDVVDTQHDDNKFECHKWTLLKVVRQIWAIDREAKKNKAKIKKLSEISGDAEANVQFDEIDVDGSGSISFKELSYVFEMAGYPNSRELARRADPNNDGKITFAEFQKFVDTLPDRCKSVEGLTAPLLC